MSEIWRERERQVWSQQRAADRFQTVKENKTKHFVSLLMIPQQLEKSLTLPREKTKTEGNKCYDFWGCSLVSGGAGGCFPSLEPEEELVECVPCVFPASQVVRESVISWRPCFPWHRAGFRLLLPLSSSCLRPAASWPSLRPPGQWGRASRTWWSPSSLETKRASFTNAPRNRSVLWRSSV